ncbi:MAG: hypothetical protein ABI629_06350 [bacterium]
MQRYKVEPYVVCADVSALASHVGRGGWTWYTGAAGWLYRAGMEWILGVRRRVTILHVDPCIPRGWPRFALAYRCAAFLDYAGAGRSGRVAEPQTVAAAHARVSAS